MQLPITEFYNNFQHVEDDVKDHVDTWIDNFSTTYCWIYATLKYGEDAASGYLDGINTGIKQTECLQTDDGTAFATNYSINCFKDKGIEHYIYIYRYC